MSLISVIIPVYNGEKTIQKTIKSVLNQTITDIEIIIINSASTDSTLEIVSQISDPRIKIFSYPKANVAVNRNRGLKLASSKFISFIDADDLWTPDKLSEHYKALTANPQAAVAYSWTNAIDEQGKFLRPCSRAVWTGYVYPQLLLDDFIGNGSNVTIRTQVLADLGGFDESLTNAQDTDMWLRLATKYHFVAVEKPQILYRISTNSMSSNLLGLEKSNLQVIAKAFAREQAQPYQHLKRYALANLYKYLSFKILDISLNKNQISLAFRYLSMVIVNDPSIMLKPIIYKAFIKVITNFLLPNKLSLIFMNKFPSLANTSTFLGYIKVNGN